MLTTMLCDRSSEHDCAACSQTGPAHKMHSVAPCGQSQPQPNVLGHLASQQALPSASGPSLVSCRRAHGTMRAWELTCTSSAVGLTNRPPSKSIRTLCLQHTWTFRPPADAARAALHSTVNDSSKHLNRVSRRLCPSPSPWSLPEHPELAHARHKVSVVDDVPGVGDQGVVILLEDSITHVRTSKCHDLRPYAGFKTAARACMQAELKKLRYCRDCCELPA